MIILDTNVLSEAMRPAPAAEVLHWFAKHAASSLYTTAITQAEILFGLELMPKGKRRAALESRTGAMFEEDFADRVLPFDTDAARMFARIAGSRRASGRPIAQGDAQIAAIARSRGATLATRNAADFEHCGIAVLNPWTAQ
jgi:predicted nucleic acid-binding protein